MKKLLENLKEAIKHYEECVDVCAAEHIMGDAIYQLLIACNNVSNNCIDMIENI